MNTDRIVRPTTAYQEVLFMVAGCGPNKQHFTTSKPTRWPARCHQRADSLAMMSLLVSWVIDKCRMTGRRYASSSWTTIFLFVNNCVNCLMPIHPGRSAGKVRMAWTPHKTQELSPDIVIMDLSMPVMNGLRATQEITARFPSLPIVMFSMYLSPHFTESARASGARGVVSKSEPQQIVKAVEALLSGNTFFPKRDIGFSDAAAIAPGA